MILPPTIFDKHIFSVSNQEHNSRLDRFLTSKFPQISRSYFQKMIESGRVAVNYELVTKPGKQVLEGDTITIEASQQEIRLSATLEEATTFFQKACHASHEHFFVIYKPAGLVTHPPTTTNPEIALSDYMIIIDPAIKKVGEELRPGIVHRLDKYTSGLLLVARTPYGYQQLKKLFSERRIKKTYYAIVRGNPPETAKFNDPIMRDPLDPRRMICSLSAGAPAQTVIETLEQGAGMALIKAQPLTGRTHQIRVHCAHHGYPLVGDSVYGSEEPTLQRYALHAAELTFVFEGITYAFSTPLPEELALYWNSCKLKETKD